MERTTSELQTNFLGRLFRIDKVVFDGSRIKQISNNKIIKSIEVSEMLYFLKAKKGLLGSSIIASLGRNKYEAFRFLNPAGCDEFIANLNARIGQNIADRIEEITPLYRVNYPRDSDEELLSSTFSSIRESMASYSVEWDRLVSPEAIKDAQEMANFSPLDMEQLRLHHESYWLAKRASFYDSVESNPLTGEQRLAVIRSNDLNMVLAAAGTGKTSVIVAKALDIIDRGLAKPEEILILAYNRKAAEEIQERMLDKAKRSNVIGSEKVTTSTFHALGKSLLNNTGIPTDVTELVRDETKLKMWVTNWLIEYLKSDITHIQGFIDLRNQPMNPFDFKDDGEYQSYIRDSEFRALTGDLVRGYQELIILNFLFINQIPVKYEAPYVTQKRIDIGFSYCPDFYLTEADIYIEHFGIDRDGKTREGIDSEKYNENILAKRKLHEEYGTTLIETFHYEWCEEELLTNLEKKLLEHGITCNPMPAEQLFEVINNLGLIADWAALVINALSAIRVESLNFAQIREKLKAARVYGYAQISEILNDLHEGYKQELKRQNTIDYDDMILKATQALVDGVVIPEWKYILVDEYQDISASRMDFVRQLVAKGPSPSLTVVGDDWQSIYRFSGGKLELTTRFESMVGKYTKTTLQKSFRYNNSIADTAGKFVMENPEQFKKSIITHEKVDSPQVYLLDDIVREDEQNELNKLCLVVKTIRKNDPNSSIAVMARYNRIVNKAEAVLQSENLNRGISYWTFHKAKGLEADYTVLLGFSQGRWGFPSDSKENLVIEALLPTLDDFPHSEERRLMYVALTRSKKKCYLIANPHSPSSFVSELLSPRFNVNIVSQKFQEEHQKTYKCPHCKEGVLKYIEGSFGGFYACSSGKGCPVGKTRVCNECNSPSIDGRDKSICNNSACSNSFEICDKCGRPMKLRSSQYGEFWGCTGYGIENDQCKNTRKL